MPILFILSCIATYLVAAIPFSLLISKVFYKSDLRKHGSGNVGATNAYRVLGKGAGLAVLTLDGAKGAIPVLLATAYCQYPFGKYVIATIAVLGHVFPVYLNFKGGKGVATSIFSCLALNPQFGIILISLWIAFFLLFRIASLASLCSLILTMPFVAFLSISNHRESPIWLISFYAFLLVIVTVRHAGNIRLLALGKEPHFSKAPPPQ